ncbi:2'-5' RNA ligase family protein [Candidatus Gracilibacteria bacterium]|nr:2'-5' RNA ligase family protein [Candidatus Gracilibacteria bacterium]
MYYDNSILTTFRMHITSHFLAVSLDVSYFADLLVALQTFCREREIESCLELQNPLSLHVTLYYLPEALSADDLAAIRSSLVTFSTPQVFISGVSFFQRDGQDYLCYLAPRPNNQLDQVNQYFRTHYPNQVEKNNYGYVPHMTLFTVKDPVRFTPHADQIMLLVREHVQKIRDVDVSRTIDIYAVNSAFSPQIQLIVTR